MSARFVKANEIESITTLAAKSFARMLEREKRCGQRAVAVTCGNDSPLTRDRFLVLRDKYIDEWQPRNVLESQMIDAICQAQTIREYWMTLATERAAVECVVERFQIETLGKRRDVTIDGSESARDAREEAERWDPGLGAVRPRPARSAALHKRCDSKQPRRAG